uniref:Uncharacterized protein n=1 Tax=Anguilla anguilla TaxID=7936 RepID=A0A0E9SHB8_ANGAN
MFFCNLHVKFCNPMVVQPFVAKQWEV